MSLLQEAIVYVWLMPVLIQIVLPLAMLILWLVLKILENLFGIKRGVSRTLELLGQKSLEKVV